MGVELTAVKPPQKACLFNLIVCCFDEQRLSYFKGLVKAILERFPCRVLLIDSVSQEPLAPTSEREQFFEFVVRPEEGDIIPFLLLPHLVSDLPIFALWGGPLDLEAWVLRYLIKLADRLIVDSESAETLHGFAKQVLEGVERRHWDLVDLNWMRIFGWREGISHLFRESERYEVLKSAAEIEITYSGRSDSYFHHSATQAIYLEGWLAGMMGWTRGKTHLAQHRRDSSFRGDRGEVAISLKADLHESAPPGGITRVKVASSKGECYSLQREIEQEQLKVNFHTDECCQLPVVMPFKSTLRSSALLSEVFYSHVDLGYLKMLHQLVEEE